MLEMVQGHRFNAETRMSTLTIAVEDDLFDRLQRYASEAGTSIEKIVRDYLQRLAEESAEARDGNDELRRRELRELFEALDAAQGGVGPVTWTRDDLYDRHR